MIKAINQFGGKMYHWLTGSDDYQFESETPTAAQINQSISKHSFYPLLPYHMYEPEMQIYHNENSLGFALMAAPLVGSTEKLQQTMSYLMASLPDDAILSVTLYTSPKVGSLLDNYVHSRIAANASSLHVEMARRYAKFLAKGTQDSLLTQAGQPFLARNYRLFISVTVPNVEQEEAQKKIINLKKQVQSTLNQLHMWNETIPPEILIRFARELTEGMPGVGDETIYYDPNTPINRQSCSASLHLHYKPDRIKISKHEIRVLYAEHYPLEASQANFMDLIGGMTGDKGSKIPCPFLFTFLFRTPKKGAVAQAMTAANWDKKSKNSWRNWIPLIDDINADHKYALKQCKKGDKIAESAFFVTLYATPETAEDYTNQVTTHFDQHQWQLKPTGTLVFPSWMSNFPMMATPGWMDDCKAHGLTKECLASNGASLAPLQGEWRGHSDPLLLFLGANGQVIPYNPYDPIVRLGLNGNLAATGCSGSGKSHLMQQIEQAVHGLGGQVFGFDEGRSHEKICKIHDGIFLDLATSKGTVLNPFTFAKRLDGDGQSDIESANTLAVFKSMVIQMAFRKRDADDAEEGLIEEAILRTWSQYGNENNITRIKEYLEGKKENADALRIAQSLTSFAEGGSFGKFFNGKATLDLDNRFVMLEIGGLKEQPALQSVLLMLCMHRITQYLEEAKRDILKLVSADEAWRHFKKASSAAFFESIARTIRKHGGILAMGSQSLGDWYSTPAGAVIFENSSNRLTLMMKAEALKNARKNDRLEMDEHKYQVLANLNTVAEQYSEIVVEGPHGYSVVRSITDNFQKALFSTTPKIFQQMEDLQTKGYSILQAARVVGDELNQRGL